MKKWLGIGAIIGVILLFGLMIFMYGISAYDSAVVYQEKVDEAWGNVQADYQRRADLVPQLVATVKGAAANEKEILLQVTQARTGIVNATTPGEIQKAGNTINRAINIVFERYPEVKSTQNFGTLQAQLEGTENRIDTSRKRYNEACREFNSHIRKKMKRWGIGLVGDLDEFPRRDLFEAEEGSDQAPEVSFE